MEIKLFKTFLLAAVLGSTIQLAKSAEPCNITLVQKTTTSATLYFRSATVSKKLLTELKRGCNVKTRLMTQAELIAFEKAAFERKIERIKAKARK